MITNVDIKYDELNSELQNLMLKNKDQSLRKLLLKSNNIYAIIIETKKQLKKLRVKAETNINYRECTYLEQKDSDVCKLIVPEFTSDMNIITFVNSIKKTMREKL